MMSEAKLGVERKKNDFFFHKCLSKQLAGKGGGEEDFAGASSKLCKLTRFFRDSSRSGFLRRGWRNRRGV